MKKLWPLLTIFMIIILIFYTGCQAFPNQRTTSSSPPALKVTFLDVGQAEATVIQFEDKTLLIDAGSNSGAQNLVGTLKNMGVKKIDVIIGTHPHEDHIGGMDAVINNFEIGTIYMPEVMADTKTFEDVLDAIESKGLFVDSPLPGNSFTLGPAICTILAPNGESYAETNDYSIVVRLVYGETEFIMTGDAEKKVEKEILDKGFTVRSNVLKVAHHGSTSSTSDAFLEAVSPEYAVIMVGKDNDYGHPHQETLDKLKTAGIKTFRTDLNGDITFTSDGKKLTVKTEK